MTAYLALRRLQPSDVLVAPRYRPQPLESLLGLRRGESDSVRDLLYGMLLPSGNDAAVDLATGVAGSVPAFVAMMNSAAARLGLTETHYSTPVGLDDPANYSSARDLAKLAGILLRNRLFARIVNSPKATLRDGNRVRRVENTNALLERAPWVNGVKTGTTTDAGDVLVSSGTRHGVTLIAVILGAPDETARDQGAFALLRYGFSRYRERAALRRTRVAARLPARHSDLSLPLRPARTFRVYSRSDQDLAADIHAPHSVVGPIQAGTPVGRATVSLDGERQGSVRLRAARFLPPPSDPGRVEQALPGEPPRAAATLAGAVMFAGGLALGGLTLINRSRRR